TSVARDELPDGGASVWAATIRAVRERNPDTRIEVLIPDFRGRRDDLLLVLAARPDIVNHNVETVPRLHRLVRPQARFERSLEVLRTAKQEGFPAKTGLMLGIGEREEEIASTLSQIAALGIDILTLGQYLRPSVHHLPIDRWVTPEEFASWKQFALHLGFRFVESGPLVRSSYHAEEQVI
ncbi:MAG: lipoyl synthase, partial [Methylacidiphilaceae bacterium]|nr:lipoyl synthase [Candidatus Methylacidiphilaceae bacterium]